jgi:uncharacterized membrane protein
VRGVEGNGGLGRYGWWALALLGAPGGAVAGYLTYSHWEGGPTVCGGVGECELVQTSEYSAIAGVPVALMGILYFAGMSLVATCRLLRIPLAMEWAQPAAFSMGLAGTAFVAYLTYVELFVLEAICPWCVSLAVMTVAGFALTLRGLLAGRAEDGSGGEE